MPMTMTLASCRRPRGFWGLMWVSECAPPSQRKKTVSRCAKSARAPDLYGVRTTTSWPRCDKSSAKSLAQTPALRTSSRLLGNDVVNSAIRIAPSVHLLCRAKNVPVLGICLRRREALRFRVRSCEGGNVGGHLEEPSKQQTPEQRLALHPPGQQTKAMGNEFQGLRQPLPERRFFETGIAAELAHESVPRKQPCELGNSEVGPAQHARDETAYILVGHREEHMAPRRENARALAQERVRRRQVIDRLEQDDDIDLPVPLRQPVRVDDGDLDLSTVRSLGDLDCRRRHVSSRQLASIPGKQTESLPGPARRLEHPLPAAVFRGPAIP